MHIYFYVHVQVSVQFNDMHSAIVYVCVHLQFACVDAAPFAEEAGHEGGVGLQAYGGGQTR